MWSTQSSIKKFESVASAVRCSSLLFCLLLLDCPITLASVVELDGSYPIDPVSKVEYFEDVHRTISPAAFKDIPFAPLDKDSINFGYGQSIHWLSFSVRNASSSPQRFTILTGARFMRPLQIWEVGSNGDLVEVLGNDQDSVFGERPLGHRYLGFQAELEPSAETRYIIRFGANGAAALPLVIADDAYVVSEQATATLKAAVMIAIIGTLMLSNLFYFIALRAQVFLLYVVQEFAFLTYLAHMDGFTFQYLWPNLPWLNANASPVLGGLCQVTAIWFSISFLQSKRYTPQFYKVLIFMLWLAVAYTAISVVGSSLVTNQIGLPLTVVSLMLLICNAFVVVGRGNTAARYYLIGWAAMLVFVAPFALSMLSLLTLEFNPVDLMRTAIIVEAIILSMGLADQYHRINEEKKQVQADLLVQLNARLEEARERTMLEREKEEALKEVLENSRVLATTSHDIAQPIRALKLAFQQSVAETTSPEALRSMQTTIDDMEAIIGDALEDASGAMKQVTQEVELELGQLLHEVAERYRAEALEKNLFIREQFTSVKVRVSSNSLKRCVGNLISNAVRCTDKGGLLIGARKRGDDVLVQVFDSGSGMTDEELNDLKKQHHKGADSPGYGLGLSIVKDICDQCGWAFSVRSVKHRGSCFSIHLKDAVVL